MRTQAHALTELKVGFVTKSSRWRKMFFSKVNVAKWPLIELSKGCFLVIEAQNLNCLTDRCREIRPAG